MSWLECLIKTRHINNHKLRITYYNNKDVRAVKKGSFFCTALFVCATLRKIDVHHRNEQSVAHYSNPNQIVRKKILKYNEYSRKNVERCSTKFGNPQTNERRVVKGGKP